MTCDIGHVTWYTWHVKRDTQEVMNFVPKFQLPNINSFVVMMFSKIERKSISQWINEWITEVFVEQPRLHGVCWMYSKPATFSFSCTALCNYTIPKIKQEKFRRLMDFWPTCYCLLKKGLFTQYFWLWHLLILIESLYLDQNVIFSFSGFFCILHGFIWTFIFSQVLFCQKNKHLLHPQKDWFKYIPLLFWHPCNHLLHPQSMIFLLQDKEIYTYLFLGKTSWHTK